MLYLHYQIRSVIQYIFNYICILTYNADYIGIIFILII
jgi:hypothetical protein